MLTTKQISEIMGSGLWMARRRMTEAGIKCEMKAFDHGRKAYWHITEEQLRALIAEEGRDAEKITMQQAAALKSLEEMFNRPRKTA